MCVGWQLLVAESWLAISQKLIVNKSGNHRIISPCTMSKKPILLTSSDGSIESDCVPLHIFAQRSFEELQGLLPLAFLTRTDGSIVSDMVSRKR